MYLTINKILWKQLGRTLRSLHPLCQLEFLNVYIGSSEKSAQVPAILHLLRSSSSVIQDFEDIVLELAQVERRLSCVRLSIYDSDLYESTSMNYDLDPQLEYTLPFDEDLFTVFTRLLEAGFLRV